MSYYFAISSKFLAKSYAPSSTLILLQKLDVCYNFAMFLLFFSNFLITLLLEL
jgi:hypothetical protein